jgi:hypothetical protein
MSATGTTPSAQDRDQQVAELLVGAVDLHCHSGPSVMPRILDHVDATMDAEAAGFAGLLFKDHYYPGMAQCAVIKHDHPNLKVQLFSGAALNNASGGVNPYTVDHCVKLGGKIIWMPTFSAANHLNDAKKKSGAAKSFPKTAQRMLDPTPLTVLDANGKLTDESKQCLDIIAEGDIILAGGHLHVTEMIPLFEEAKTRGVKKLMVNHPTYVIGCSDADMKDFVAMGAYLEHSICMFIENSRAKHWEPEELARLIRLAGADHTVLGSDLGLTDAPRPVDGYRAIVRSLLDLQFSPADIRMLVSSNAAKLLGLPQAEAVAQAA